MLWPESISARCRGAATASNKSIWNSSIIWEDSIVGEKGHVFCIGLTPDNIFFRIQYKYDTYENDPDLLGVVTFFKNTDSIKTWLKELRSENHPKIKEIIPIMRFFLT